MGKGIVIEGVGTTVEALSDCDATPELTTDHEGRDLVKHLRS